MKKFRVVYVGLKEMKADNVAGTGLVWTRGEVHEVEDEEKAAKLFAHPLIWQNADEKYELVPEPKVVPAEPRVSISPENPKDAYWDPIVEVVPAEVFTQLQTKELVMVFMTPADADRFAAWKMGNDAGPEQLPDDTAPKNTGPKPQGKGKSKAADNKPGLDDATKAAA